MVVINWIKDGRMMRRCQAMSVVEIEVAVGG